ncbi:MAG: MerR family transcriptional regulator [Paracoccaceae bacterium]
MAPNPADMLPIGHIARRTGLAVSAIRYYEDQGLIRSTRSAGGQRRFARAEIRRLSFIRIAQGFGFTLPQIRDQLASLPQGRTSPRPTGPRFPSFSRELTKDRGADQAARRSRRLHRLRLPQPRPMPALQPRGPCR